MHRSHRPLGPNPDLLLNTHDQHPARPSARASNGTQQFPSTEPRLEGGEGAGRRCLGGAALGRRHGAKAQAGVAVSLLHRSRVQNAWGGVGEGAQGAAGEDTGDSPAWVSSDKHPGAPGHAGPSPDPLCPDVHIQLSLGWSQSCHSLSSNQRGQEPHSQPGPLASHPSHRGCPGHSGPFWSLLNSPQRNPAGEPRGPGLAPPGSLSSTRPCGAPSTDGRLGQATRHPSWTGLGALRSGTPQTSRPRTTWPEGLGQSLPRALEPPHTCSCSAGLASVPPLPHTQARPLQRSVWGSSLLPVPSPSSHPPFRSSAQQ